MSEAEVDKLKAVEEAESQHKEQEDLLVLLADQDSKLSTYKKRLRELGEKVQPNIMQLNTNTVAVECPAGMPTFRGTIEIYLLCTKISTCETLFISITNLL